MSPDSVVAQFAQLLAVEENPAERARLVKRAELLAMNQVPEEAFEPPVRSLGAYLDTPIPVPPSLVWPTIVVRGEITVTLGRAGKGKTTANLNRLVRWSAGKPWFDGFSDKEGKTYLAPDQPLRCLIIENEGNAGMFHHKMGVLLNNCGARLDDHDRTLIRENIHVWGDGGYSGLKLDDPSKLNEVRAGVEKVKPDILFIEPFRGLWKGEENSSTDMANVVDNIIGMATDYGCGVILSHHERKSGAGEDGELMSAGRGSTVLEGAAAVMENFQSAKGGDYRELTWSKARYLQPPVPLRLQYDSESGWYDYVPLDAMETTILMALEEATEALNLAQLEELTGETQYKLRKSLNKLKDEGRVKTMASSSDGRGTTGIRYRLPSGDNDDHGGLPV